MADAEKCFDKLWLNKCIVDLGEVGIRERESELARVINERVENNC